MADEVFNTLMIKNKPDMLHALPTNEFYGKTMFSILIQFYS